MLDSDEDYVDDNDGYGLNVNEELEESRPVLYHVRTLHEHIH